MYTVEVKISEAQECYSEMLITYANQTKFLTPRTHIIKDSGTQIECNHILPTQYFYNDQWLEFLPKQHAASRKPTTLQPVSKGTWEYQDIPSLATSGIYTQKDLTNLRDRIMFPIEQPAVVNEVAREIRGYVINNQDGTIGKLLNENVVEKMIKNAWTNKWGEFLTFGTVSARIFSVIVIIQGLKMIISFLINGYALHQVYGWSIHLLGAIWSSLTAFLVYAGRARQANKQPATQSRDVESVELTQQQSSQPPSKLNNTTNVPEMKVAVVNEKDVNNS